MYGKIAKAVKGHGPFPVIIGQCFRKGGCVCWPGRVSVIVHTDDLPLHIRPISVIQREIHIPGGITFNIVTAQVMGRGDCADSVSRNKRMTVLYCVTDLTGCPHVNLISGGKII